MELDFLENETLNEEILLHVLLLFRLYGRWPVYITNRKKGLTCIERERGKFRNENKVRIMGDISRRRLGKKGNKGGKKLDVKFVLSRTIDVVLFQAKETL